MNQNSSGSPGEEHGRPGPDLAMRAFQFNPLVSSIAMRVRLLGTVFLVASCMTGTLYGQPAPFQTDVGHPFLTYFGPADYDAAGQNWAIIEDERGVIYVGNNVGLLEYDGVSWRLLASLGVPSNCLTIPWFAHWPATRRAASGSERIVSWDI